MFLDKSTEPRDVENDGSRFWSVDLDTADENVGEGYDGWVAIVDENEGGVVALAHESNAGRLIDALRAYTGEV